MGITKLFTSPSSHRTLRYVMEDRPHNTGLVQHRNLLIDSQNVAPDYDGKLDYLYTEAQFAAVREVAQKSNKKTQAHHIIFSFSDTEFPVVRDSKKQLMQAKQVDQLVRGFLTEQLPSSAQYILAVQRDGDGAKLHAHVVLNSVLKNGKTLDTNDLSLVYKRTRTRENGKTVYQNKPGFFDNFQDYLDQHFKAVTGRSYTRIYMHNLANNANPNIVKANADQIKKAGRNVWREDIKAAITDCVQSSNNLQDFIANLRDVYDIEVKQYESSTGQRDNNGNKIMRDAFTYIQHYTNKAGRRAVHKVRDYHVTKRGTLRGLGTFSRPSDIEKTIEYLRAAQAQTEALKQAVQRQQQSAVNDTNNNVNKASEPEKAALAQDTKEVDKNDSIQRRSAQSDHQSNKQNKRKIGKSSRVQTLKRAQRESAEQLELSNAAFNKAQGKSKSKDSRKKLDSIRRRTASANTVIDQVATAQQQRLAEEQQRAAEERRRKDKRANDAKRKLKQRNEDRERALNAVQQHGAKHRARKLPKQRPASEQLKDFNIDYEGPDERKQVDQSDDLDL